MRNQEMFGCNPPLAIDDAAAFDTAQAVKSHGSLMYAPFKKSICLTALISVVLLFWSASLWHNPAKAKTMPVYLQTDPHRRTLPAARLKGRVNIDYQREGDFRHYAERRSSRSESSSSSDCFSVMLATGAGGALRNTGR
jgi:hypothetical protein